MITPPCNVHVSCPQHTVKERYHKSCSLSDVAALACKHNGCRNAGEMKGITMEQNKQQLAALKKLLDLPHNKQCADCVGGGGAARASWASINTGVFICMRCAGIHRGLGVHVSKVRHPTCTVLPLLAVTLSRHSQECCICGDPSSC